MVVYLNAEKRGGLGGVVFNIEPEVREYFGHEVSPGQREDRHCTALLSRSRRATTVLKEE